MEEEIICYCKGVLRR